MDQQKPKIVYPQEKHERTYGESLASLGGLATSLIWGASNSPPPDDKDHVTTAKFVDIELAVGTKTPCLLVGYENGFQVWDLTHTDKEPTPAGSPVDGRKEANPPALGKITELFSLSQSGFDLKQIYVLPRQPPDPMIQSPYTAEDAPFVAVVTGKEPSKLILYGICSGKNYAILSSDEPIIDVLSNLNVVVLVTASCALILNSSTYQLKYKIPMYAGNKITKGVATLGPRWLAYQCSLPSPSRLRRNSAGAPTSGSPTFAVTGNTNAEMAWSVLDQGVRAAVGVGVKVGAQIVQRAVASDTLQSTGGGYVTIIDVTHQRNNPDEEDPKSDVDEPSLIHYYQQEDQKNGIPVDLHNHFQIIAHFKAEIDKEGALSAMCFDHSGSLLAVASEQGDRISIFQIDRGNVVNPLYFLTRGHTAAIIKQLSFSVDSKLIELTSDHGTTHVYGLGQIQPIGNTVPKDSPKLAMIKSNPTPANEDVQFGGANRFLPKKTTFYKVLNFGLPGVLSLYHLDLAMVQNQPAVKVIPVHEWLLQREKKWPSYQFKAKPAHEGDFLHSFMKKEPDQHPTSWFSNIEAYTTTAQHTPLWKTEHFKLMTCDVEDPPNWSVPLLQDTYYQQIEWKEIGNKARQPKLPQPEFQAGAPDIIINNNQPPINNNQQPPQQNNVDNSPKQKRELQPPKDDLSFSQIVNNIG